jgi:hypothetical protein
MSDGPSLLKTMAAAVELHQQHHRLTAVPSAVPDAVPVTKAAQDWPSSLTIMKRVPTPPAKEEPMSDAFSNLLKAAVNCIERGGDGDLETAERLLSKADKMVDNSVHHHHHYGSSNGNNNSNDDDDDEDDGWDDGYSKAKRTFVSPSDPASDEPDDDEDDDMDGTHVKKADYHHDILGGSAKLPEAKPTPMSAGGRSDTYSLGSPSPDNRTASTHKFDRLVEHVQERDGCSKNEAMATARREYPDVYTAYQDFVAGSPTSEQHSRRGAARGIGKSMPDTFEDLVATEMAKGCSWRTAEQRVINTHGSTALNHRMIKRDGSITREFTKRANAILEADGCDRTEALRRLRKEQPHMYDALNNS